jgi:single-strand DNA-binding protein
MNNVNLIGRIGKLENRYTPSGVQVCKFSLATTKKVKGEKVTTWHNVVAFNKVAEIIDKYTAVGDLLCVQGEIVYRTHEKDGAKHYYTDIIVNQVELLGSKKSSENASEITPEIEPQPVGDDEIPF